MLTATSGPLLARLRSDTWWQATAEDLIYSLAALTRREIDPRALDTGSGHASTSVGSFAGAILSSTNVFQSWQCGHCHSSSVLR